MILTGVRLLSSSVGDGELAMSLMDVCCAD